MDLNYLDKTSKVVPMLVKLHDSHQLYDLARDKKPMAQEELSSAVAELLDMETSERERELIADVLISLMRQAEKDLKMALADKLSRIDHIPLRLALHIANAEIEVASPVLKNSMALGDMDLVYIIHSKPSSYWRMIAQRKVMSDQLISSLVDTKDNATVQCLLENMDIVLPEKCMHMIIDMAEHNETIARPLVARPEIDQDIALSLYRFVGHELKKHIAKNFDIPVDDILDVVDETVLEFQEISASEFTPTKSMLRAAARHKEKSLLGWNIVMGNLRRGQLQNFIAQLSVLYDISPAVIEDLLSQPKGHGAAMLCKAYGVQKADFVSVFLLTNRMREVGRMVDVNDMHRAVNYYNKLTQELAERFVQNAKSKKRQ